MMIGNIELCTTCKNIFLSYLNYNIKIKKDTILEIPFIEESKDKWVT